MNRISMLCTVAAFALAGCTSSQLKTASGDATIPAPSVGTVVAGSVSKPTLAQAQKYCADFTAVASATGAATGGGAKTTVNLVANPGIAFCKQVAAGTVPVNADSNTQNWLSVLTTTLQTVEALAPLAGALL